MWKTFVSWLARKELATLRRLLDSSIEARRVMFNEITALRVEQHAYRAANRTLTAEVARLKTKLGKSDRIRTF